MPTPDQAFEIGPYMAETFDAHMALAEKLAVEGEVIRLRLEVCRLRDRIGELEDEIARLKSDK